MDEIIDGSFTQARVRLRDQYRFHEILLSVGFGQIEHFLTVSYKTVCQYDAYPRLPIVCVLVAITRSISVPVGVMSSSNKFEQVSSNHHQMSVAGGSHVWYRGGCLSVGLGLCKFEILYMIISYFHTG